MYSEETNKKKMRDFNRFMNSVLESQLLRSNELVELFMTKNPDEFHVIKLKYKNISKLTSMNDFHSLTGDLDVTYYINESHSSEKLYNNIEKKRNILKEIKNMCNDAKYAKINLEKCENAFNNFKNEKNNKNKDNFNYELQKKQIEKTLAQRTCNFLRNRAFEEYQRIMDLHHIRIKNYFSQVGANISELLKNEYTFSMQIIQCFNII